MSELNNEYRERARKNGKLIDDLKTMLVMAQNTQRRPDMLLFYSRDPESTACRFEQLGGDRSTDDQGRIRIDWRGFHMTLIPITEEGRGEFA
jgi:hypothetical protein